MTSQEIAERIEARLEEMGKTKVWFSENSGISRATLHLWKNNKAFPTKEYLEKVKNTIGIEFAVFEAVNGKPAPSEGDGNSEEDAKILTLIRHLDRGQKLMLIAQLETLVKAQEASQ